MVYTFWHRASPSDRRRARRRAGVRRDRTLVLAEQDRVEIVLLSAEGWSSPRHADTVRAVLERFLAEGPAWVHRGLPGPRPDTAHRVQLTAALDALLGTDRTGDGCPPGGGARGAGDRLVHAADAHGPASDRCPLAAYRPQRPAHAGCRLHRGGG